MIRPQFLVGLLAAAALMSLALIEATAGEKDVVKVAAKATATKPDKEGKQTANISIEIPKGWYIYANPVQNKDLQDNRTLVTVKAKEKVVADVKYPTGKEKVLGPLKYYIYTNSVEIPVALTRVAGDSSPLEFSVEVNLCNTDMCLPTTTVKFTVP